MKIAVIASVAVLSLAVAWCQARRSRAAASDTLPLPNSEAEKKILAVIEQMRAAGTTYLSVPVPDGRMLRLLTESLGAKTVVEIGTSTGYSGLWFLLALESTGGKLTTFEYDKGRAATARKHFDQSGFGDRVTIVQGDAHQNVKQLKGPVDLVFIDADKEGYVDYLRQLLPLVRPGGLLLAHNVGMSGVNEYVEEAQRNPDLETVLYSDGGGMAVTMKKR